MDLSSYHLDLAQFTLERFQKILESGELLPSRRILLQNISERFAVLKRMGIHNLQELVNALSSKKRIELFAGQSGLPQDYLEILVRQTRIYTPQPVALKDFPGVEGSHIARLADQGIHNSRQLFTLAGSKADRELLSARCAVPQEALLELVQLSDLVRAGWVGPIFARLFYEAGVHSIEALLKQDAQGLYAQLSRINKAQNLTRGSFTVKDVALCIEISAMLPIVIEV